MFDKLRILINSSWHKIGARLIYGLQHFDDYEAMEFASVACTLKYMCFDDVNYATIEELLEY